MMFLTVVTAWWIFRERWSISGPNKFKDIRIARIATRLNMVPADMDSSGQVGVGKAVRSQRANAGFWMRLAAAGIDILIPVVFAWTIDVVLGFFNVPIAIDFSPMAGMFLFASYLLSLVLRGGTAGKFLLGLSIRRANGQGASYPRVLLRETLGKCICLLSCGIGFLWVGFSRSKRGWHDYLVGTGVIATTVSPRRRLIVLSVASTMYALLLFPAFFDAYSTLARNTLPPDAVDAKEISQAKLATCVSYLQQHATSPHDYVISKFKDHDVVIIGEGHLVAENCQFVSGLMQDLYHKAGVRHFAMEFMKYKYTALANEIVTAENYDEEQVKDIFRDFIWPSWVYQEYMDELRAIWEVNRQLPQGTDKLKITGLDKDINGWNLWLESPRMIWDLLVMIGRDKYMARVLSRDIIGQGNKILVHVGSRHDFTKYHQPVVVAGALVLERPGRLGCMLYRRYQKKVFQIALHREYSKPDPNGTASKDDPSCLSNCMENIFRMNGDAPVGFDVERSPFACLRDSQSYYFRDQRYVTLSHIAQGYVFLKPLSQLHQVTLAEGFINERSREKWTIRGWRAGWLKKGKRPSLAELNRKAKEAWAAGRGL